MKRLTLVMPEAWYPAYVSLFSGILSIPSAPPGSSTHVFVASGDADCVTVISDHALSFKS